MQWNIHDDSVYFVQGRIRGYKVAAFDFDGTLAQSDVGNTHIKGVNNWVSTTSRNKLITTFDDLIGNDWTIVIFAQHYHSGPIQDTLDQVQTYVQGVVDFLLADWKPFIYVTTKEDKYDRPSSYLWDLFMSHLGVVYADSESFYCGDADIFDNTDRVFAENCGLHFCTPFRKWGVYESEILVHPRIILVMAANASQYRKYIDALIEKDPSYLECNYEPNLKALAQGRKLIVVGPGLFATQSNRKEILQQIPPEYHTEVQAYLFTQPIQLYSPHKQVYECIQTDVDEYAANLDVHLKFESKVSNQPFPIVRIN